MRKFIVALIIAFMAPVAAGAVTNSDSVFLENPKEALADLDAVFVYAKSFDESPETNGMYEFQLRDYAAYILRHYGVIILTEEELTREQGRPVIRITLNTKKVISAKDTYSYALSVSLQEVVSLERNPGIRSRGITWQKWSYGVAENGVIGRTVKDDLKVIMDDFIKEYLRVRPKENRY